MKGQSPGAQALAHMAQKYGGEFVYAGPWGTGFVNPAVKQLLVRRAGDDRDILVTLEGAGADRVIKDNYLAVKYRREMEQLVTDAARESFGRAKVFYQVFPGVLDPDLSPQADLRTYCTHPSALTCATVAVDQDHFREDMAADFAGRFAAAGIRGKFRVAAVSPEEYEKATPRSISDLVGSGRFAWCAAVRTGPDGVRITRREGR